MKKLLIILCLFLSSLTYGQYYVVGQVKAYDDDSLQRLTYKLVRGGGGYFKITESGMLYYDVKVLKMGIEKWEMQVAVQDNGITIQRDGSLSFSLKLTSYAIIIKTFKKEEQK